MRELLKIGERARKASLIKIQKNQKNSVLKDYCLQIKKNKNLIIQENHKDLNQALKKGLKDNLVNRLTLNEKKN